MSEAAIYRALRDAGVVPVLTIENAAAAEPLAAALLAGGLPLAEITFRTPNAAEALAQVAKVPDMLAGAGTITNPDQVETAVTAGARFIVSPGFSEAVFDACRTHQAPYLPGVATASEIQRVVDHGIEVVKFFPAQAMGGMTTVAALAAPYPRVRFLPTGGIDQRTAAQYLAHPAVLAVGGSWMAPNPLVQTGDFPEITRRAGLATAAVATARGEA